MNDIRTIFDIWNDSIKAVVFGDDDWKTTLLAKHIEPTRWLRKWKILEAEEFSKSLNNIVENFIKRLWWDFLDKVYVWVSHPDSIVKRLSEHKRIMTDEITANDVKHLSTVISDMAIENNMTTIKIIPVHRVIDKTRLEKDPISLKGKDLELVADAFMIPKNFYNWIIEAFDNIGLTISDIVPNILSASELLLDYDRRDLWTLLIDIWKNQTTYTVYEESYPLCYGTLPIGWENVTKDISIWMQMDIKEAEDLKKTHGTAIVDKNNMENMPVDIHFLTEIISSRYEQIFNKINSHLQALDKDWRLAWWVILIWWWAKLPNLDILCKDVFKLATYPWKDRQLNLGDISSNIQFTNVLWTFIWTTKYEDTAPIWGFDMSKARWKIKGFLKDLF